MRTNILPGWILPALLLLAAGIPVKGQEISCKEASLLIGQHARDTGFVILDLRSEKMFRERHIENAVLCDVFSPGFTECIGKMDRSKTYLLYCTSGHRSRLALEKMEEMGFKKLYHMYEGIDQWEKEGYRLIKN